MDAALISEQWDKLVRIPRRDMSSCNRYIADEPLRRVIQRQPNREEARQCARAEYFLANQGEFRMGDYEEIVIKASCPPCSAMQLAAL